LCFAETRGFQSEPGVFSGACEVVPDGRLFVEADGHHGINTDQGPPKPEQAMSVSKVECNATVRGKGKFTLGLYRHLAPVTVTALLDEFPVASRAMVTPGAMICLLTKIKIGVEKQRLEFSKGDVAFLAANGSICIFLANVKSQRPLNPVGKVEEGIEVLQKATSGDVVEIAAATAQAETVQM
jgi:uncharacterized protein